LKTNSPDIRELALQAVTRGDWQQVNACAMQIARHSPDSPDAPFLMGLLQKAARKAEIAADYFDKALSLNTARYDAAIELAGQNVLLNRYGAARSLLDQYRDDLGEHPHYLDMAGQAYFSMSMYEDAWPLLEKAVTLQADAEVYQMHLASCAVYLGKIDQARAIYQAILKRHPKHQKVHYELAQLQRVRDDRHIKKMLKVLKKSADVPANNVYLLYALGKEYEDLGKWHDAFRYYEKAGAAVKTVANYDVADDVRLMDKIIETCTLSWLEEAPSTLRTKPVPIFIVGLPRTGTTLTDRILSSHSEVQSIGETQLLQMVLRDGSRAGNQIGITPEQIRSAAQRPVAEIASAYLDSIAHRLGDSPYFIEKLPENVLYLGFIAKAWPDALIVHVRRNPMDACFAAFKQSFFRFAYSLDDLAAYYLAYDRLSAHLRHTLGSRMVELRYEDLVSDQESQTRLLLDTLGLEFEEACLSFEQNAAPVATASSVQVREKVHTRSIDKWKKFKKQLQPLRDQLENGGVVI
jgi:tetratricopeptide (TPR) repeat protein